MVKMLCEKHYLKRYKLYYYYYLKGRKLYYYYYLCCVHNNDNLLFLKIICLMKYLWAWSGGAIHIFKFYKISNCAVFQSGQRGSFCSGQ